MMPTEIISIRPLSAMQARRMGLGILPIRRTARELKEQDLLTDDMDNHQRAEVIALAMMSRDQKAFEAVLAEDGRDWEAFFAAIVAFLEKLMPLIMLFL